MSNPNHPPSSGNKRTFGTMNHQDEQDEIAAGGQETALSSQRKQSKTEHSAGHIDSSAHQPGGTGINPNIYNPFHAASPIVPQERPAPNQQVSTFEGPNIAQDHHSITAPPGEWTSGLPFTQKGWERVNTWRQKILPPEPSELTFWDDIEYFSTKQRHRPTPMYDRESPIGYLERYRWMGQQPGDPPLEAPVSWEYMLAFEKTMGGNMFQDLEKRQQKIRKTKERQMQVV